MELIDQLCFEFDQLALEVFGPEFLRSSKVHAQHHITHDIEMEGSETDSSAFPLERIHAKV
ncbi:MAG: hypothetical protein ACRD5B_15510 [Nitrososphaeraceae archaeon]